MKTMPTPIEVTPGEKRCCNPGTDYRGTTPTVDVGVPSGTVNALWSGQLVWSSSGGGSGGFAIGVCCALSITLRITGTINILDDGQHDISVYLNGALLWSTAASTTAGQAYYMFNHGGVPTGNPFDLYPYYEGTLGGGDYIEYHEIVIPMTQMACGNIIEVVAGTTTTYPSPTGNASWSVVATAIG